MLFKIFLKITLLLIFSASVFGQEVDVKGKVRDALTDDALEFANVALLSRIDSSLITGATADLNGNFGFKAKRGQYLLRVGFIGYDNFYKTVEVKDNQLNLGILKLNPGEKTLDEVTVTGVTSMFESDIDKRVYNVENNILAEGGTASQLLNTLPSIQINEEGGISMRGSGNVLIYINGRPSNLSSEETENILSQFPANSIKSVELITNPSSRYDAQGVGGIINIILKKNVKLGWNGQVNSSIGTRDKYQAGVNLNYGSEKWTFNSSYNFQSRRIFELSESLRTTVGDEFSPFLDQDFDTRNRNQNHLINLGLDHHFNENVTLGVYSRFSNSSRDRTRIYNQRYQDAQRNLDSLFVRTLTEDQSSFNLEVGTTLDYDIDTLGQKLYATFSYAYNEQDRIEYFDQRFFDNGNAEIDSKRQDQIYGRPQESDLFIGQLDYTKPFGNGGRLETGIKGTFSYFRPLQTFEQLNLNTNEYVQNDTIANRFDFEEKVIGGYGIYRNNHNKIGYQVGLRAEQTFTDGLDQNSGINYVNEYFNLFPSLFVTYEVAPESEFTVNYSRRINRPSWGQFAPFYNAQDLLNTRLGNPNLRPEFTDSYELGYSKGWAQWLLSSTVYHRRTTDAMTRVISLLQDNAAVQLWDNANWRRDTGLEMIHQLEFASNLDLTLTGNFFYSQLNGENIRENFNNSNFTWTVTMLGNWVIPNVVNIQLMADYRGPIILPQGEIEPIYGLDLGIRRDILKNRATVSVNISDLFNTRVYRIQTDDIEFSQSRFFNQETRIGTLSFVYRFGGFKSKEETKGVKYSDDPF
ncbi:TonB-dependent receptor domain-containing protein [Belliella pelovolcani]|uniref:TonB-dependent receptor domain-containing protein n=1 Tax=Belliella pelovolcani TaxID=529505 RepID=UPI00391B94FF